MYNRVDKWETTTIKVSVKWAKQEKLPWENQYWIYVLDQANQTSRRPESAVFNSDKNNQESIGITQEEQCHQELG